MRNMSEMIKNAKRKVLILGNSHLVVFGFRGEIIERLISEGYEVVVVFPNGPFGEGETTSKDYGCKFIEVPINRRGMIPTEEIKLINRYKKIINAEKPDVVLGFTVKCNIYGGIACRITKTPFVANITGIGKGLAEKGLMQKVIIGLYKIALKKAEHVYFQNTEDKKFFDTNNIRYKSSKILPGSGVNLTRYSVLPYPSENPIVFTYIARVMKAKGIELFLEAANYIKVKYPNTEFHVCGYCEEDYQKRMEIEQEKGTIIYHGLVKNIVDYEALSSCVVLPTFHPEGISNVLLEAAACGRPVITTDRAGCRETVDDGVTGFLIKEKSCQDLIDKMEQFIKISNDDRMKMGLAAREKIEREFDRQIVVEEYLKIIRTLVS